MDKTVYIKVSKANFEMLKRRLAKYARDAKVYKNAGLRYEQEICEKDKQIARQQSHINSLIAELSSKDKERCHGNRNENVSIQCPYFRRFGNDRRTIVCEGITTGAECRQTFQNREQMKRHCREYCNHYKRFRQCHWGELLAREDEKEE